jgi:hypothetical protein
MRRTVPLSELLEPRREAMTPEEAYALKVPFVEKIRFGDGAIELREDARLSKTGAIVARAGDLLVSKINVLTGAVGVVPTSLRQVCASTHYTAYVVAPEVDPAFLWHSLRSPSFVARNRAALPNGIKTELGPRRLLALLVRLPESIEEQRERVRRGEEIGTAASRALNAAAALRVDVRQFAEAYAAEVLSESASLQELRDLTDFQPGYAFKSDSYRSSGIPLLRGINVGVGCIDWSRETVYLQPAEAKEYQRFSLRENDIVIGMDRPLISGGLRAARISRADVPALLLQRTGRFVDIDERLAPDWLYFFLRSALFRRHLQSRHERSVAVPHISKADILSAGIPLPPVADQARILAELEALDGATLEAVRQIERTPHIVDRTRRVLLDELFTLAADGDPSRAEAIEEAYQASTSA